MIHKGAKVYGSKEEKEFFGYADVSSIICLEAESIEIAVKLIEEYVKDEYGDVAKLGDLHVLDAQNMTMAEYQRLHPEVSNDEKLYN